MLGAGSSGCPTMAMVVGSIRWLQCWNYCGGCLMAMDVEGIEYFWWRLSTMVEGLDSGGGGRCRVVSTV